MKFSSSREKNSQFSTQLMGMRPIREALDNFSFPKVTNQLWTENFSDQFTSHVQDTSTSLSEGLNEGLSYLAFFLTY